MSSTEISDIIIEKLEKAITDPIELKMIIDILQHEKRYSTKEQPQRIKKEFQLLVNQYFPLKEESEDE